MLHIFPFGKDSRKVGIKVVDGVFFFGVWGVTFRVEKSYIIDVMILG